MERIVKGSSKRKRHPKGTITIRYRGQEYLALDDFDRVRVLSIGIQ